MNGKNVARTTLARRRESEALSLRMAGAGFDQIAGALGLAGPGSGFKCYRRALERLAPTPAREEIRALEAARLDRLQLAHWQKAVQGDIQATATLLSIMSRRARLLGLDMSVDVNLNALLTIISELRQLPEPDLLEPLGYHDQEA